MRLFVAVEIEAEVADAARRLIGELQTRVARMAPASRVSWVPASRLHLTVRFLGQLDRSVAEDVCAVLRAPLLSSAFDLSLAGLGVFPDRGPPRVVWVGVRDGTLPLQAVGQEVDARLAGLPVPARDGPLRPHVTLGRVRRASGLRAARVLEGLEEESLGGVRVEAVTLFESRASPAGPLYVPLLRMPLVGPCAGGSRS